MEEKTPSMKLTTFDEEFERFRKQLTSTTVEERDNKPYSFRCNLAAIYGNLNRSTLEKMDEKLKVMIGVTTKEINKLEDLSWDKALACMMQNAVVEPIPESDVTKSKISDDKKFNLKSFFFPKDDILMNARKFICELINGYDIFKDTDIDEMADIVAQHGESDIGARHSDDLDNKGDRINVGILRYPDIESPTFKLYRIRLNTLSDCGIKGDFNYMEFKLRDGIIDCMSEETKAKAIAYLETLFA